MTPEEAFAEWSERDHTDGTDKFNPYDAWLACASWTAEECAKMADNTQSECLVSSRLPTAKRLTLSRMAHGARMVACAIRTRFATQETVGQVDCLQPLDVVKEGLVSTADCEFGTATDEGK